MLSKYFPYIAVVLMMVIILQGFLGPSEGLSESDVAYRIKMHDIEQERLILIKKNNQLEFKIQKFKNEILKSDTIIDNYTNNQTDSFFTNYFE